MRKLPDSVKEILMKGWILFCSFWMLAMIYVGFNYECEIHPEWEPLFWCMFASSVVFVSIIVWVFPNVNFSDKENEPGIKNINCTDYADLEKKLTVSAENAGYSGLRKVYLNEREHCTLLYKCEENAIFVFQTVWLNEFTLEGVDSATDIFWTSVSSGLDEDELSELAVTLMQCICVPKINYQFRKFVRQNVEQDYKRNQILSAVTMATKKIYIAQSKGQMFRHKRRKLLQAFDEIIKEMLV